MRIRISFLCGLAAIICVLLGLLQIYAGESIFAAPFNFTPRALLIGAGVVLLFGINCSCGKK